MSNYRIVLSYHSERNVFVASAPELDNCLAEAETRAEALTKLEQEMAAQVENMKEQGLEPPVPIDAQELSGKIETTVSLSLHRDLAFLAKQEKRGLDELLPELLAAAVSGRTQGFAGRGRPRTGAGQGRDHRDQGRRYHQIMDSRADFIEYVRSQEPGAGGRGRGPGPGNLPRGRRPKRGE